MSILDTLIEVAYVSGLTLVSFSVAFCITSQFVYSKEDMKKSDDDNDNDFCDTYTYKFYELKNEEREIENLDDLSVELETPKGVVVMKYDLENKTFNYYSDRRSIPNRFLDVVAQKFVIDNDCRIFYNEESDSEESEAEESDNEKEIINESTDPESYYNYFMSYFYSKEEELKEEEPKEEELKEEQPKSVFIQSKKIPINTSINKNKEIIKKINKYIHCGTLDDLKKTKIIETSEKEKVTFSVFKELYKNKTE